ncbi:hypothetical protein Pelo_10723 [Pelomyxa schiedti]|nr:hypothetical protein Pelo_10699 [Pelomyxa schiedti]KAH3757498.1 hypothetical protein Pelo_10723 [Pelomyxa schiedti]
MYDNEQAEEPHNKKPRTAKRHNVPSRPQPGASLATRVQYHLTRILEAANDSSGNNGTHLVISAKDQFIALSVGAMIRRCAGFHGDDYENGRRMERPTTRPPIGMTRVCRGRQTAAGNYGSALWVLSGCPGVLSVLGQEWVVAVERRAAFTIAGWMGLYEQNSPPYRRYGIGPHIFIAVSYTLGVVKCRHFVTEGESHCCLEGYIGSVNSQSKLAREENLEKQNPGEPITTSTNVHSCGRSDVSGGGGDDRIVVSRSNGSVVDVIDCSGVVVRNLFTQGNWGYSLVNAHCNSHWIVLHHRARGPRDSVLFWRVVDGLPETGLPHRLAKRYPSDVCFSGWNCDVLLLFGTNFDANWGCVTLVDLKESCGTNSVVVLQELTTPYTMYPERLVGSESEPYIIFNKQIYSPESNRTHKIGNEYPIDVISTTQFCVSGLDTRNTPIQIYTVPNIDAPSLTLWPRNITEPEPLILSPCKIPFQSGIVAWNLSTPTLLRTGTVLTDLTTGTLLAIVPAPAMFVVSQLGPRQFSPPPSHKSELRKIFEHTSGDPAPNFGPEVITNHPTSGERLRMTRRLPLIPQALSANSFLTWEEPLG